MSPGRMSVCVVHAYSWVCASGTVKAGETAPSGSKGFPQPRFCWLIRCLLLKHTTPGTCSSTGKSLWGDLEMHEMFTAIEHWLSGGRWRRGRWSVPRKIAGNQQHSRSNKTWASGRWWPLPESWSIIGFWMPPGGRAFEIAKALSSSFSALSSLSGVRVINQGVLKLLLWTPEGLVLYFFFC